MSQQDSGRTLSSWHEHTGFLIISNMTSWPQKVPFWSKDSFKLKMWYNGIALAGSDPQGLLFQNRGRCPSMYL